MTSSAEGLSGRRKRVRAVLAALCLFQLVAACGGGSDPEPTPTLAVATAPAHTPTPSGPATIEPVVWAERIVPGTNAPEVVVDQFTTEASTIYAVMRATNLASGAVVSATWTYNNTSLDSADQSVLVANGLAEGYIEFHLTRSADESWPDGIYAVEITLDGQVVQQSTVHVVDV